MAVEEKSLSTGIEQVPDQQVTWDGPEDPANPKNWPFAEKWKATMIVSAFTFISPISTSMIAPALSTIKKDLNITQSFELYFTLSVFVLAYAFGPFLAGPLSELFGRSRVLQAFNVVYLIFNTACGFAQTGVQLIVFRFLAGAGGSAGLAVGAGVLGDVWKPEQRGLSISIYTMITLLGPTLGPLLGGFITQYKTWRWAFWAISSGDCIIQVAGLFLLRETYPPWLLGQKAVRLRRETGNQSLRTKWEQPDRTFKKIFFMTLARPFIMLGTQPIVQALALYIAFLSGLVYLVLATFASVWTERYNESISISGLNYLSIAIGYVVGTQSCAWLTDKLYLWLKTTRGRGTGYPEYRLPLIGISGILVPAGIALYGWSAQAHLHWLVPNIGTTIFAIGVKIGLQCTQIYALDVYPTYAASASAASSFLRSLTGFSFPLFAPYLYRQLDLGWGNTVLALIALIIGVPSPILLWFFGPNLRAKSKFAQKEQE